MEILLETFVLFSCLMFWVVFFHKKGTLAKLKKIEASIKSKIHILEDLMDRHQAAVEAQQKWEAHHQKTTEETPAAVAAVITTQNTQSIEKPQDLQEAEVSPDKEKPNLGFSGAPLKNRVLSIAGAAKTMAAKSRDHIMKTQFDDPRDGTDSQSFDKTASPNVFEQKIENMLKSYGVDSNAKAASSEENSNASKTDRAATSTNENEPASSLFSQPEKVSVPRTKPVESFEDLINLSKALEKNKTGPQ